MILAYWLAPVTQLKGRSRGVHGAAREGEWEREKGIEAVLNGNGRLRTGLWRRPGIGYRSGPVPRAVEVVVDAYILSFCWCQGGVQSSR